MKLGVLALLGGISLGLACPSLTRAEPSKITEGEKQHCAQDYKKFCGEYGLESSALRGCMDRNGRSLSHNCIEALIDAGEVSRSEVERRKTQKH
jgi:hypothetical protein